MDRGSDSDRELNNVRCLGGDDCNWCVRGSCSREYGDRAGGFAMRYLFIGYEGGWDVLGYENGVFYDAGDFCSIPIT